MRLSISLNSPEDELVKNLRVGELVRRGFEGFRGLSPGCPAGVGRSAALHHVPSTSNWQAWLYDARARTYERIGDEQKPKPI